MSSRSITIAIAIGLGAVLCVCMSALIVAGGAFFYGFSGPVASPATTRPPVVALTLLPSTPVDSATLPAQSSDELNEQMDLIEQQVKDLRGWSATRAVPRNFYNSEQLRDYQLESFEKDYSSEEAQDDVISLVAFGLLDDPNYDLYTFYIDLYSENILGFYDPDVAELYIISDRGGLGAVERTTFAHEYLHALQDQNYGFDALGWNDEAFDADSQRFGGLQAMMEGEAMLLESQWDFQYFTQADWDDYYANGSADPNSAFFRAPIWLQEDFAFPYFQGYEFVNALYERGGWAAVDAAYGQLPLSTEMILHLDKYDDYDQPIAVPAPPLTDILGADWRVVDTNNQGEWYTFLVLKQFLSEDQASAAAAGWGGDRYTVVYNDATGQTAAAWHLVWDSNGDVEEFVDAFKDYGDSRFGVTALIGEGSLCWDAADTDSCLYFNPQATVWILAPDLATVEKVRAGVGF